MQLRCLKLFPIVVADLRIASSLALALFTSTVVLSTTTGAAFAIAQQSQPSTATGASPQRFIPADDATPIRSSAPQAAANSQPVRTQPASSNRLSHPRNELRWRSTRQEEETLRASAPASDETHRQVAYLPVTNGNGVQLNSPVAEENGLRYRTAQQVPMESRSGNRLDPINDPFGDRTTPSRPAAAAPLHLDSAPIQARPATLPPQEDRSGWQSAGVGSAGVPAVEVNYSNGPAQLNGPVQVEQETLPPPPVSSSREYYAPPAYNPAASSSRSYGATAVSYQSDEVTPPEEARAILQRVPVNEINLNVTPWYGDQSKDYSTELTERASFEQMQASRDWQGPDGTLLAQGRMLALENRQITIVTDSGRKQRIWIDQLSDLDRQYAYDAWRIPEDEALLAQALPMRDAIPQTVTWKASALCHKPLYFEDIQLERYGHSAGPILQPIKSSAHFFANMAIFPYNTGIHPMTECQYSLGYYRPGDCAPWLIDPVPLSLRGALRQAGIVTAGALTIP